MKKVCILDYDSGNVQSLKVSINFLDIDCKVSNSKKDIKNASHVLLPGVGSYKKSFIKLKKKFDIDLFDWIKKCEDDGCGEILLNSVDRDGKKNGFDLHTIKKVLKNVKIPLIFCGGAGKAEDFYDAFKKTSADALAASNLFHHIEHGDYIIKKYLFEKSINVRKPSFFNKEIFK